MIAKQASIKSISGRIFRSLLEENGYSYEEPGIFSKTFDGECEIWLGLATTVKSNEIAVDPVLGIRNKPAQQMIYKMLELCEFRYNPPTVSSSIGFLLPDSKWKEWYFDLNDDQIAYRDLVSLMTDIEFSFFVPRLSLAGIEDLLADYKFVSSRHDRFERLPVIRYLNGDTAGALRALGEFVDLLKDKSDPRSIAYCTTFARNFRDVCV